MEPYSWPSDRKRVRPSFPDVVADAINDKLIGEWDSDKEPGSLSIYWDDQLESWVNVRNGVITKFEEVGSQRVSHNIFEEKEKNDG